jgi:RNA polymerase sigma-70 factor (ECF subfamily)
VRQADFVQLYEHHRRSILRYAAAHVGGDAAEDVTAATFIEAWRCFDAFDASRGSETAWLYGIASNVLARQRREEAVWLRNRTLDARAEAEPIEADTDGAAELIDRIAQLEPRERDPLLLYAIADLSYEDIAAALDIPIGTVRSRISRATARIRTQLTGANHGI